MFNTRVFVISPDLFVCGDCVHSIYHKLKGLKMQELGLHYYGWIVSFVGILYVVCDT